MPRSASIRPLLVPALLAALFVCAFLPSRWMGWTRVPHGAAEAMVGPVARLFTLVAGSVRPETDDPIHLRDLHVLNRELQEQYAKNLRLEEENYRLRRENAALQELRERFDRSDFVPRMAQVMGRSIESSTRTLTINRGARAQLREGMPVVIDANLVGRLTSVGRVTSTVQLITTPGTKINAVLTPPTWEQGRLARERLRQVVQFEALPNGRLQADAHRDVQAHIGDIAHLRDLDGWPESVQGMILGRVVDVQSLDEPVLRIRITVEPLRPLQHLDEVTLIVPRADVER